VPTGPARERLNGSQVDPNRSGQVPSPVEKRVTSGATRSFDDHAPPVRRPSTVISPLNVQSPASDNGASTPLHSAPAVLSMLPKSGQVGQQNVPHSIAALRSLKLRKEAIANNKVPKNPYVSLSSSQLAQVQAQCAQLELKVDKMKGDLQARQSENAQLKTRNEQLAATMKVFEDLPNQMKRLESRFNQMPDPSSTYSVLQTQVTELEKPQITEKQPNVEVVDLIDLRTKVGTLQRWQEAQSDLKSGIEAELAAVREAGSRVEECQKTLRSELQTAQTRLNEGFANIERNVKSDVMPEMGRKPEADKKDVLAQIKAAETRLNKRIDDEHRTVVALSSGFNVLTTFKQETERNKLSEQLQTLEQRIKDIAYNEEKTFDTAQSASEKVHDFDQDIGEFIGPIRSEFERDNLTLVDRIRTLEFDISRSKNLGDRVKELESADDHTTEKLANISIVVGQVKNFQSEQGRMSNEQKRLVDRVIKLEQKALSAKTGLSKVGKFTGSSSSNSDNSVVNATKRLDKLDEDVNALRRSHDSIPALKTQIAHVEQRLGNVDDRLQLLNGHSERLDTVEGQSTRLRENLERLDGRVTDLHSLAAEVRDIRSQVEKNTELQSNILSSGSTAQPPRSGSPSTDLFAELEDMDKFLNRLQDQTDLHSGQIDGLREMLPELFTQKFDPFKRTVEERFQQLDQTIQSMAEGIAKLAQQSSQTPAELAAVIQGTKFLKQDMAKLQKDIQNETSLRGQDIRDVKHQLAEKIDSSAVDNMMDHFRLSFESLQHQYNNITSDDLHGRMVKWFLENYPGNAANMVRQFATIQQEVQRLKALSGQLSWVQTHAQDLAMLLQNTGQLQGLLQSAPTLQQLPQIFAKSDQAARDAQVALETAVSSDRKMIEQAKLIRVLDTITKKLEQDIIGFRGDTSPFAKTQAIRGLEESIQSLRTTAENSLAAETEARVNSNKELRTSAGVEYDRRSREYQQTKSALEKCTADALQVKQRIDSLDDLSQNLRRDVNAINQDFIEPNKEFFGIFPSVVRLMGQFQLALEQLNMNLPKGSLSFQWMLDLRDVAKNPVTNDDTNGATDKGKQKQ
jgi:DNA repair exonuclease SbcCD ATPase subunit